MPPLTAAACAAARLALPRLLRRLPPARAARASHGSAAATGVPLHVSDMSEGQTVVAAAAAPPSPTSDPRDPIVFIHGLLGSGTNFRSIATHPAIRGGGRRVLAVDLRNHGASPHGCAGPVTLEEMAGDVGAALRRVLPPGRRAVLVGHSLGGKVAALTALQPTTAPLVSRLVVMDIAPVAYSTHDAQWAAVAGVVRAALGVDAARFTSRAAVDAALAAGGVPDAGMRSFVCQNLLLAPGGGGAYSWRVNLPALAASLGNFAAFPAPPPGGPLPPNDRIPVHFVGGARSRYILPDAHGGAIRAFFPRAALHVVPEAGHWIHADQPAAFVALLAGLLA